MKKLIRFGWAIKYLLRNKADFDVLEGFLSHLLKEKITIENLLEALLVIGISSLLSPQGVLVNSFSVKEENSTDHLDFYAFST